MTGARSADVEESQRQWRSVRSVLNSTVMSFLPQRVRRGWRA